MAHPEGWAGWRCKESNKNTAAACVREGPRGGGGGGGSGAEACAPPKGATSREGHRDATAENPMARGA